MASYFLSVFSQGELRDAVLGAEVMLALMFFERVREGGREQRERERETTEEERIETSKHAYIIQETRKLFNSFKQ